MANYLKTIPPTFDNKGDFLSFKQPAASTFTSFSPASDVNAYLQAITGLSGWKQRNLLQSKYGTEILNQAANGSQTDSISYLRVPGFHSKAACQTDSDCSSGQTCYTFNSQTFGPQQGPTCSDTVYPEVLLGNVYNQGAPLRQHSNSCYTDDDCKGIDQLSGQDKHGMQCNHNYKGPNIFEKSGLCQVQYESNGRRYFLQQPPGWKMPLQEDLQECSSQADCGPSGVNGWSRCSAGAADGKMYCVWPGQTNTPSPSESYGQRPKGMPPSSVPTSRQPGMFQKAVLDVEAEMANTPSEIPGGGLGQGSPIQNPASLIVEGFANLFR
jgi:hypothetical protein